MSGGHSDPEVTEPAGETGATTTRGSQTPRRCRAVPWCRRKKTNAESGGSRAPLHPLRLAAQSTSPEVRGFSGRRGADPYRVNSAFCIFAIGTHRRKNIGKVYIVGRCLGAAEKNKRRKRREQSPLHPLRLAAQSTSPEVRGFSGRRVAKRNRGY